jgi:hypothetical protein
MLAASLSAFDPSRTLRANLAVMQNTVLSPGAISRESPKPQQREALGSRTTAVAAKTAPVGIGSWRIASSAITMLLMLPIV